MTKVFEEQITRLSGYVTNSQFTHSANESLLLNETFISFKLLKEYIDSISPAIPESNLESTLESLVFKLENSVEALKVRLANLKNESIQVKKELDTHKLMRQETTQEISTIMDEQAKNKELLSNIVSESREGMFTFYANDSDHTSTLDDITIETSLIVEHRVTNSEKIKADAEKINSNINALKEVDGQNRKDSNSNMEDECSRIDSISLKISDTDMIKDIADLKTKDVEMNGILGTIESDLEETRSFLNDDKRRSTRRLKRIEKTLTDMHNDSTRGAIMAAENMVPIAGPDGKIDKSWLERGIY